jgi:hypothetical protein
LKPKSEVYDRDNDDDFDNKNNNDVHDNADNCDDYLGDDSDSKMMIIILTDIYLWFST